MTFGTKSVLSASVCFATLLGVNAPALAQATELNDTYRVETEDCPGCGAQVFASLDEFRTYVDGIRMFLDERHGDASEEGAPDNVASYTAYGDGEYSYRPLADAQVVFLDFKAGGAPTFPVCAVDDFGAPVGVFGIFNDHVYTKKERKAILKRVREDYSEFNFRFVQREPSSGDYTTVFIGQNDAPEDCSQGSNISVFPSGGVSILFGSAFDGIDFRNQDRNDRGFTDASFWEFLAQLDPTGATFEAFSSVSLADFGGDLEAAVSFAIVNQTSNTTAHEAGHLQGLRHQNSFGAPGDGLPNTGAVLPTEFVPTFDGPSDAAESVLHTMASGASVGLGLDGSTITDRFFSERSAARLAIAEQAIVESEGLQEDGVDFAKLTPISVPNTIEIGENEDAQLRVRALVVEGSLDVEGEVDSYYTTLKAGEFFNAELISVIGEQLTFEDGILGQVRLYQIHGNGAETLVASNLQSFESVFDAEIFDYEVQETGRYRIEVSAPDEFFVDLDGDGVLDPITISADGGAPELLVGEYSIQLFTCEKRLRKQEDYQAG